MIQFRLSFLFIFFILFFVFFSVIYRASNNYRFSFFSMWKIWHRNVIRSFFPPSFRAFRFEIANIVDIIQFLEVDFISRNLFLCTREM